MVTSVKTVKNTLKDAPINYVEYQSIAGKGNHACRVMINCAANADIDSIRKSLGALGDNLIHDTILFDESRLIVLEGTGTKEKIISDIKASQNFSDIADNTDKNRGIAGAIVGWVKSQDMLNWRGHLGLAGQAFQIISGKRTGDIKYSQSAAGSLISNLFPSIWGVQKGLSGKRTALYNNAIDDLITKEFPDTEQNNVTKKLEQEHNLIEAQKLVESQANKDNTIGIGTILGQANDLAQANSLRISDGIKILSKANLITAGTKKDKNLSTIGKMSLAAKFVTMAGKSKDHESLDELVNEEKYRRTLTPLQRAVEKLSPMSILKDIKQEGLINGLRYSATTITGYLEIIANAMLIPGAWNIERKNIVDKINPETGEPEKTLFGRTKRKNEGTGEFVAFEPFKFLGGSTIVIGMIVKALAPFSQKFPDQEEVFQHIAEKLKALPEDQRETQKVKLAAYICGKPGFESITSDKKTELTTGYIIDRIDFHIENNTRLLNAAKQQQGNEISLARNEPSAALTPAQDLSLQQVAGEQKSLSQNTAQQSGGLSSLAAEQQQQLTEQVAVQ